MVYDSALADHLIPSEILIDKIAEEELRQRQRM